VTVIVVGVTPTSLPVSVVVLHLSEVVAAFGGVVDPGVSPPTFFPLLHPAAISTTTSSTPTQPNRLNVPPLAGSPPI
jgi:hypothetical protein